MGFIRPIPALKNSFHVVGSTSSSSLYSSSSLFRYVHSCRLFFGADLSIKLCKSSGAGEKNGMEWKKDTHAHHNAHAHRLTPTTQSKLLRNEMAQVMKIKWKREQEEKKNDRSKDGRNLLEYNINCYDCMKVSIAIPYRSRF